MRGHVIFGLRAAVACPNRGNPETMAIGASISPYVKNPSDGAPCWTYLKAKSRPPVTSSKSSLFVKFRNAFVKFENGFVTVGIVAFWRHQKTKKHLSGVQLGVCQIRKRFCQNWKHLSIRREVHAAFEACAVAMLMVEAAGRIELVNEVCEQMFGYATTFTKSCDRREAIPSAPWRGPMPIGTG